MKHTRSILAALTALLLLIAVLTGCSSHSASSPAAHSGYAYDEGGYGYAKETSDSYYPDEEPAAAEPGYVAGGGTAAGEGMADADLDTQAQSMAEKIIYQGSATIETTEFDETLDKLDKTIARMNGFVERTEISGQSYESSYYKKASLRYANYTIRIPKQSFTEFKSGLDAYGYVTNTSYWTENVTARYMDVESRLAAYRAEETSLLAMMEKADTVEDMITVESRLSDVRYEIESLTSTLRYYQNQVDYSTMTLTVREVKKITEEEEIPVTYWDEIKSSFRNGWRFTVETVQWIGKAIVTLVPALIIPAIVVVVIILLVRRAAARRRAAAYAAQYRPMPQNPNPQYVNPPAGPQNPGPNPPSSPDVRL